MEQQKQQKQYVEQRADGYWVAGSRVSLESVIWAFLEGLSPETIAAECFPVLSLEQVYGVITYYLSHRAMIDAYLQQSEADWATFVPATHDASFAQKVAQVRRASLLVAT